MSKKQYIAYGARHFNPHSAKLNMIGGYSAYDFRHAYIYMSYLYTCLSMAGKL